MNPKKAVARSRPSGSALRGGLGLERFYAAAGYKEVGRVPDGLRLAADDYRDDIMMWLPLS